QVHQEPYAEIGAGNTADRHGEHDFSPHGAFDQVDDGGGNLGEEVTHGVATDGNDRRNVQPKNEQGQQQYTAAQTRHSDQRSNREADQYFQQQKFHAVFRISSQFPVPSSQQNKPSQNPENPGPNRVLPFIRCRWLRQSPRAQGAE